MRLLQDSDLSASQAQAQHELHKECGTAKQNLQLSLSLVVGHPVSVVLLDAAQIRHDLAVSCDASKRMGAKQSTLSNYQ